MVFQTDEAAGGNRDVQFCRFGPRAIQAGERLNNLVEEIEFAGLPRGPLIIGTPQDVADEIIGLQKIFGNGRILVQMGLGSLPHQDMLRAIELMGNEVVPLVRAAVSGKS